MTNRYITDPNDARTFQVAHDREGFFIVDGNGTEVLPRRWSSWGSAQAEIKAMILDDMAELASRKEGVV